MNWEAIGAVGEILGALAVIATLGYLAIQIRQSTRVSRAAAYRAFYDSNSDALRSMAEGLSPVETMTKGFASFEDLNTAERTQFYLLVYRLLAAFETSYFQFKDGLLPAAHWQRQKSIAKFWLTLPGVQAALPFFAQALDEGFLDEIRDDA